MKMLETAGKALASLLSVCKVLLKSSHPAAPGGSSRLGTRPVKREDRQGTLIVMGNGPSLRETIEREFDTLRSSDTMALNFAANSPEFFSIMPANYILADPHFFSGQDSDPNVGRLWENLSKTRWPMILHIPATYRRSARPLLGGLPSSVTLCFYNLTPVEGLAPVSRYLFRHGFGMPRPRNVLVPALMQGIRMGYRRILIAGADHTWPHSLYVDDRNRVVTVQPHFYKDNSEELDRVAKAYEGIRLHDVLGSMTIAFRSYHEIEKFARREGVEILNATPGSLIDAFARTPRLSLK